jgi:hypothetical protein
MPSCPKCDGFSQRFNIGDLREYQDIVRQLIEVVNQGTFLLVQASCPLQEMLNTALQGDTVFHKFQCFACGRPFQLFADTFHGWASWTIGDSPKPVGDLPKPN